ncbi:TorF family putative porin [Sphingomonadaceae bacterium]|nr:TorF family putative porin [Sphingomonadaceae bacterium]
MLTSKRSLRAAKLLPTTLIAAGALYAAPAFAQDEEEAEGPITVSANVALTSEYRFRGVDLSDGDLAIQGGFDVAHESGFYIGTWASSLDEDTVGFGSTELDVYGGWSGDLTEGVSADVGVIQYIFPNAGAGDFDYTEFYASAGFTFGPAETTVGVAYAPKQDSLGTTDNFYVYSDIGVGIPDTPITVTGHLGYTDGFLTFTNDGKAFDYSIGAEAAIPGTPASLGIAYVGAEGDIPAGAIDFVDDAVVVTLSASF